MDKSVSTRFFASDDKLFIFCTKRAEQRLTIQIARIMKVVHVHFFKKKGECQDFYFGSVAAMYEVFSAEDIGRAYNTITRRLGAKYYRTDNCYIRIGEIQTKKNAK